MIEPGGILPRTVTREVIVNRTKRLIALVATLFVAALGLSATSALVSSPAIAATASSSVTAPAFDPFPRPPWVFSGHAFSSLSACEATGRAYVNTIAYSDYTCRYSGGVYRLYLLPE
ncbi:hypothetical protein Aau02nite_84000 [Amorphoplanes auranticolor]|uniref:Uncharacterized protein n=1 Tax=Actinoplanes auranticolor TaxID=47988 RepID=A0A919W481_9ACTN|nr:hypothetical protein Aau02nite_84000 [Actinoplanes auranticolor]